MKKKSTLPKRVNDGVKKGGLGARVRAYEVGEQGAGLLRQFNHARSIKKKLKLKNK